MWFDFEGGDRGRREMLRLFASLCVVLAVVNAVVVREERGGENTVCKRREVGAGLCPELFVLGAQKSGTSSLFGLLLNRNLQISMASNLDTYFKKETHYFDVNYGDSLESYAASYPSRASNDSLSMDCTPYFANVRVAPRIQQNLPYQHLRFIISVRDPVTRAYSWYSMIMLYFLHDGYAQALAPFDNKFSLMAKYSQSIITDCLQKNQDKVQCTTGFSSHLAPKFDEEAFGMQPADFVVPETGIQTTDLVKVVGQFSDGLYGPLLHEWYVHLPS